MCVHVCGHETVGQYGFECACMYAYMRLLVSMDLNLRMCVYRRLLVSINLNVCACMRTCDCWSV